MTITSDQRQAAEVRLADVVRSVHDGLDLPDGFRAEILEGNIIVVPTAFGRHSSIIEQIRDAVRPAIPPDFRLYENTTLQVPSTDRYVPDLAAWPFALIHGAETQWVFPAAECAFAVEVTSPNQESRDYGKAGGYARGGVPIYLLVDRKARKCVVYTEPTAEGYATQHNVPFGHPLVIAFEGGSEAVIETTDF